MRLIDLVLPPACAGCGRPDGPLCGGCQARLPAPGDPRDRFVASDPGTIVGDAVTISLAAYAYQGPMRRALAALKYTGASRLAPVLASLCVPTLDRLLVISGPASLTPIPLHPDRRAIRGFNQAELIAAELARMRSLRVSRALVRVRATSRQHRLNRVDRLKNLRGAFVLQDRAPRVTILVDDIITTAATLEACGSILRAAGSEIVYGLAVAREV